MNRHGKPKRQQMLECGAKIQLLEELQGSDSICVGKWKHDAMSRDPQLDCPDVESRPKTSTVHLPLQMLPDQQSSSSSLFLGMKKGFHCRVVQRFCVA